MYHHSIDLWSNLSRIFQLSYLMKIQFCKSSMCDLSILNTFRTMNHRSYTSMFCCQRHTHIRMFHLRKFHFIGSYKRCIPSCIANTQRIRTILLFVHICYNFEQFNYSLHMIMCYYHNIGKIRMWCQLYLCLHRSCQSSLKCILYCMRDSCFSCNLYIECQRFSKRYSYLIKHYSRLNFSMNSICKMIFNYLMFTNKMSCSIQQKESSYCTQRFRLGILRECYCKQSIHRG